MLCRRAGVWTLIAALVPWAAADEDYVPAEALREAGLTKAWQLRLPLERDQRLANIYVVDDQWYATTDDGYVFAVHADTGAIRWLRQAVRRGYVIRRPCHAGSRAIFTAPATVLQVDRLSGEGVARWDLTFPAGTAPVTDGTRLFLGGLDQRLYAADLHDRLRGWKAMASGPITSTPVLHEGNLLAASADGTIYCCTAGSKAFRWQRGLGGSVTADLAANAHGLYVANGDQSLYLLDFVSGQVAWQVRFSGPLSEAPVLTPDVAYQYCPDDGLVAVNCPIVGVEERIRWKLPRGRTLLTTDAKHAFVLARDETILVVRVEDGEVVQAMPAVGLTLTVPSPERTAIYLASHDGRLFCARPRGTPLVTQEDIRKALATPETMPAESAEPGEKTVPGGAEPEPDRLGTSRSGLPLGGKSKVSKSFGKGGSPAAGPPP